jgi:hypothetical protein
MDPLGREDMSSDRFDQRPQRCCAGADPIGERRDIELDAFARSALPVERQMQAVLGEQDMGGEFWAGTPARSDAMTPAAA